MKFSRRHSDSAFTMIEIAMALAIIGFALVAIIGILPQGIDVQKDNRRETIINQDANYLIEAIRSGQRGLDDLTNYVMSVTNNWTFYSTNPATATVSGKDTYTNVSTAVLSLPDARFKVTSITPNFQDYRITNGLRIIGVLSTPKYVPAPDGSGFYSNNITAYFRALSGSAFEKSPQSNDLILGAAFSYRLTSDIIPYGARTNTFYDVSWTNYAELNVTVNAANRNNLIATVFNWRDAIHGGTNNLNATNYLDPTLVLDVNLVRERVSRWLIAQTMHANLYEARLYFRWPLLPGANLGNGRQTYRMTMHGALELANDATAPSVPLYIMKSDTFTNLVPYYTNSL